LSASQARAELRKRGVPKELFWPNNGQRVIMLEPADKSMPDRIFLMTTRDQASISAYTIYPGFPAIKPQWHKMPLTEKGFREVMSARGVAFYPKGVFGKIMKATAGRRFGRLQIHGLVPDNRIIVTKGAEQSLNPPGKGPRGPEVSQHRIVDFMINVPEGLEKVSVLLYMCGHGTDIEMIGSALQDGILK